jgi:hypothetical protein
MPASTRPAASGSGSEGNFSLGARGDKVCIVRTDKHNDAQVVHTHPQGRLLAPFLCSLLELVCCVLKA